MPVDGVSLLGFMDEGAAVEYLRVRCYYPEENTDLLAARWNGARTRLKTPTPRAGYPDIQDVAGKCDTVLKRARKNPRFDRTVAVASAWSFQLVEIAPLLAFQFDVETPRARGIFAGIAGSPSLDEIAARCLPSNVQNIEFRVREIEGGVHLVSEDVNFRLGVLPPRLEYNSSTRDGHTRVFYGEGSPLVQVVRFEGSCYLRNGFHRAYCLATQGVTHMPCVLLETSDARLPFGIGGGGTFSREILESSNPPTCGHFSDGRGYSVLLRKRQRIIQITWAEGFAQEPD